MAYFSTFSRIWELTVGALIALLMMRFAFRGLHQLWFGWIGASLIVCTGFFVDAKNTFPGIPALIPVVGTALVILGSGSKSKYSVEGLLNSRLLRWVGNIAYPLYLWHWPILVFYVVFRGYDEVGWLGATGVLALSLLAAIITQSLVSRPVMTWISKVPPRTTLRGVLVTLIVFVLPLGLWSTSIRGSQQEEVLMLAQESPDHPGALLAPFEGSKWHEPFRPSVTAAREDLPIHYAQKCHQSFRDGPEYDEVKTCHFGETTNPTKRIVMTSGSHVMHWQPALLELAMQERWELITVDKDGCRFIGPFYDPQKDNSCRRWNAQAFDVVTQLSPDIIFTVSTRTYEDFSPETLDSRQVEAWQSLDKHGIRVIAVRDTPRSPKDIPTCVEENTPNLSACSMPRDALFSADYSEWVGNLPPNVTAIDMTDTFCDAQSCPAIIGNVLVYRDQDHITATFARSLAEKLKTQLSLEAPWLFSDQA